MTGRKRYAIVTPYHKEERWMLERCIRSVKTQTTPADHFMIADGHPQDWIDGENLRHVRLDREHSDYGNTPRTLGALLAVSENYDGIGFLDADNWLEPDHIATCVAASSRNENCDYVIARRNLCRPDGSVIDIEERDNSLVDTSCFFLLPGSYHAIPHFLLTPREFSPICDRVFYSALKAKKLQAETAERKTVNYHCMWKGTYLRAGETPPPDTRPEPDLDGMKNWLASRTARQLDLIHRRIGYRLALRSKRI